MAINWFEAALVFRIIDDNDTEFEKQHIILKANSKKEAYQKALIMASAELDKRNYIQDYTFEYLGIEKLEKTDNVSAESFSSSILEAPKDFIAFVTSLRFMNLFIQSQLTQPSVRHHTFVNS